MGAAKPRWFQPTHRLASVQPRPSEEDPGRRPQRGDSKTYFTLAAIRGCQTGKKMKGLAKDSRVLRIVVHIDAVKR